MTHHRFMWACLMTTMACHGAFAEEAPTATSESRDAASAFIGSMNFTVGRIGRDCLTMLDRKETPQQFAATWQQRNIKYVAAASKYLQARIEEATAKGDDAKNAVLQALANTRATAAAGVEDLYARSGKEAACKRMVALIDSGTYGITPAVPMFNELEALAAWAQP